MEIEADFSDKIGCLTDGSVKVSGTGEESGVALWGSLGLALELSERIPMAFPDSAGVLERSARGVEVSSDFAADGSGRVSASSSQFG